MSEEEVQSIVSKFQEEWFVPADQEDLKEFEDDLSKALMLKVVSVDEVNFKGLSAALRGMWILKNKVRFVEIDNGQVMAKFTLKEDMEKVFDGGPWLFDDKVIMMSRCEADLAPDEYTFNSLAIWVQFHNVPLGATTDNMLRKMAGRVGVLCKIDRGGKDGGGRNEPNKIKDLKRKYVRCRIRINPTKPICTGVFLERRGKEPAWIPVKYERLPDFCFDCGACVHENGGCKNKENSMEKLYRAWMDGDKNAKWGCIRGSLDNGGNDKNGQDDDDSPSVTEGTGVFMRPDVAEKRGTGFMNEDEESRMRESWNDILGKEINCTEPRRMYGEGVKSDSWMALQLPEGVLEKQNDVGSFNEDESLCPDMECEEFDWADLVNLGPSHEQVGDRPQAQDNGEVNVGVGLANQLEVEQKRKAIRIGAKGRELKKKARTRSLSVGVAQALRELDKEVVKGGSIDEEATVPAAVAARQHRRDQ